MKRYLHHPIISIKDENYISFLIVLAPLLNFLPGLNIDMYAPSLPAIAKYYAASAVIVKNTMTMTLLGMALGSLLFGALMDTLGRKHILMIGIFIYVLASFFAPASQSISQLLFIRFMQGFMVATVTVGCRALIMDSITGKAYMIAMLYSSIAYGLAPIIGPFFGSILQTHFNWQANFIAFGLMGSIFFMIVTLFIKETIPEKQTLSVLAIIKQYFTIMKHRHFMAGILMGAITQIELMIYPTLGPFIIENILHRSAITYGNTALVVGGSYLCGALCNRFLLHYLSSKKICNLGFILFVLAALIAFLFAMLAKLNLLTLMLPLILMGLANGFIFPNIMGTNLRFFPKNAGVAMATHVCLLILLAAVGLFFINYFYINDLVKLAYIYTVLITLQIFIFFSSKYNQFV